MSNLFNKLKNELSGFRLIKEEDDETVVPCLIVDPITLILNTSGGQIQFTEDENYQYDIVNDGDPEHFVDFNKAVNRLEEILKEKEF